MIGKSARWTGERGPRFTLRAGMREERSLDAGAGMCAAQVNTLLSVDKAGELVCSAPVDREMNQLISVTTAATLCILYSFAIMPKCWVYSPNQ